MTGRPLDVCFVALHALPAMRPSMDRPLGGTETRAWIFARGLASLVETSVRFVVRGEQDTAPFVEAGVQVLPHYDRLYSFYESVGHSLQKQPGFPWLKLQRFHSSLLWQLPVLSVLRLFDRTGRNPLEADPFYEQIETDVFCTFGVQANSARVIASAHAAGKPVVLMIGSDGDLDERYTMHSNYVSQYGDVASVCHWILQQADVIVAQTAYQQQLLQERFGRTSSVVANPFDLADWDSRANTNLSPDLHAHLSRYALWVGRAEPLHKRPQLLLEVARRCPEVDFLMVLNRRDPVVEREIHRTREANIQIIPAVPYDLMPAVFSRAAVLVSTSALEGFPNVFLQAVASGVPIGSLEVGEEFLRESNAGECTGGDLDRLAAFIRRCWTDKSTKPVSSRDYLREHHDLHKQVDRLRNVLTEAVQSTSKPTGRPVSNRPS